MTPRSRPSAAADRLPPSLMALPRRSEARRLLRSPRFEATRSPGSPLWLPWHPRPLLLRAVPSPPRTARDSTPYDLRQDVHRQSTLHDPDSTTPQTNHHHHHILVNHPLIFSASAPRSTDGPPCVYRAHPTRSFLRRLFTNSATFYTYAL